MFKLLRFFTITSLVAFIIVAVLLGLFYRDSAVGDLLIIGESQNVSLTQTFANNIWSDYADFLIELPSEIDGQTLQTDPHILGLHQRILGAMQNTSIVKVKIYNLQGLTLFSTESRQIGEDKSANLGYLSARNGEVASELTHRDTFSAFEEEIVDRDLLSSYIPIRTNPESPIEGVFEVYTDVTPFQDQINNTQRTITIGVSLIMALLYIILFFIIRQADTIMKEQYKERQLAAETLRRAKEEAEKANRAKTEFISTVSHELRSPMTAIDGYIGLVNSGKVGDLNQKQRAFLTTARNNLGFMNQIVSDLSDISRIEANHFRLEIQSIDPIEVVKETAATFERQFAFKQQNLVIESEINLPDVLADRLRLIQILSNLLSNAHKYTPDGGLVILNMETAEKENQPVVQFKVKDSGIGIGEDEKSRIFEKFFRSADREALKVHGTGLGLNLTRHLVNLHQGQIWFESQLRQGSTFYFTIPTES